MPDKTIRLMIVDDHQLFIDGLIAILKFSTDIEVVGLALNGQEALKLLPKVKPDVVITDISMPVMNGFELAEHITSKFPHVNILALSMFNDISSVQQMLNAGVKGYILKNTGRKELENAIRAVAAGQKFFSEEVSELMIGRFVAQNTTAPNSVSAFKKSATLYFSRREKQIIQLIKEGLSNNEIGERLELSHNTIASHRKNIYSKLKVSNTAQLLEALDKNNIDIKTTL